LGANILIVAMTQKHISNIAKREISMSNCGKSQKTKQMIAIQSSKCNATVSIRNVSVAIPREFGRSSHKPPATNQADWVDTASKVKSKKRSRHMEITVKVLRVKYNRKDGTQGETLALEFENGKQIRMFEDRWNYRIVDFLNELLDGKGGA